MNLLIKTTCYALFGLFLLALWLPLMDNWRHFDQHPAPYERRELAAAPALPRSLQALRDFPTAFETFFKDHFGFRNTLIHWNSVARARGLGISSSDRVMLGKENWIFLSYPEAMNTYRVLEPLPQEKLTLLHKQTLTRAQWCAKRGIKYLDVWLPEKQSVYPEYLPGWVKPLSDTENVTRFVGFMQQDGRVPVLNLGPVLRQARQESQIFYSGDSHWNSHGAYAAYLAIAQKMKTLGVPLRLVTMKDLVPTSLIKVGDVSEMLNMEAYYQEQCLELRIKQVSAKPASFKPAGFKLPGHALIHPYENKNKRLPRMVMFADSFGYEIMPFFAESFSRAVYVRQPNFSAAIVEQEKPDIVLELHVARHLESEKPREAAPSVWNELLAVIGEHFVLLHAPAHTRPLLVTLPLKVQTYDIDFANHVNNAVYIRWLEDLRMEILRQYCPLQELMAQGIVPILASTHIVYKRSIDLFDEPVGHMWCTQLGRATLTLESEITVGEQICATATQRGIMLYRGTTRGARIPDGLREQFLGMQ